MSNVKKAKYLWRPLLTETLPYEVPVIFSNDRLYAALVSEMTDADVKREFSKIIELSSPGSSPYSYRIGKDRGGLTDLAIVHPVSQLQIAEFYDIYATSILDYCKKSEFSLRRPSSVATSFSENELDKDGTLKLGVPNINPEEGEIDVSRLSSYFAYSKYNLLHRFYDSSEFLHLEKRFSRLRTLDVTKCFFNIYTHTITWAVKERTFAKEFRNAYSFEARFDSLMQRVNSSETNGIVVGPEFSRIFAEIIFQEIDKRVINQLKKSRAHNQDYAIRRYVDDYLIFSNSSSDLDLIENVIREELGRYKLFLNEKKIANSSRPFVTPISLARREIAVTLGGLRSALDDIGLNQDERQRRRASRAFAERIRDIRLVVAKYSVGFHTISGWLLSTLKPILREVVQNAKQAVDRPDELESITNIAASILEVVFYVCALDLRVRTSYSLCQIVAIVQGLSTANADEHYDRLMHIVSEELSSLINNTILKRSEDLEVTESVELYNLIICGAHHLGPEFVRCAACQNALRVILQSAEVRYFAYITAKFCFLKAKPEYQKNLDDLNHRVSVQILNSAERIAVDAEHFLLFSDFVGAPDVALRNKREVLEAVAGGRPSNDCIEKLGCYLGFADWSGMQIEHTLVRKELRPAYAWA